MTNTIRRKFHLCFSRLKNCSSSSSVAPSEIRDPNSIPSLPSSSSVSSSTLVLKNPSPLHDPSAGTSHWDAGSTSSTFFTSTTDSSLFAGDPDLSSAIACRRLLLPSSPRRSNAIADAAAIPVGVSVVVPTYSADPYKEFRKSMQEMALAMGLLDGCGTRSPPQERLYELLLCYLALNRKHNHKYIVSAFSDLFVISESAAGVDGDREEEAAGCPRSLVGAET